MRSQKWDGDVAQSVEQRTENPCVVGSIPIVPTKRPQIEVFFYFYPMATHLKNLDNFNASGLQSIENKRIGIVTAEWNEEVTFAMRNGAIDFLKQYGALDSNLVIKQVPGSFELVYGAQKLLEREQVDGVIAIGCVIQGETPHFDFICQALCGGRHLGFISFSPKSRPPQSAG